MCSATTVDVVADITCNSYCERQSLDMVWTNAASMSTIVAEKSDNNNDDQPNQPVKDNSNLFACLREEKEVTEGHLREA